MLRPFDGERDHREFSGVSGEADRRIFNHFQAVTDYGIFAISSVFFKLERIIIII